MPKTKLCLDCETCSEDYCKDKCDKEECREQPSGKIVTCSCPKDWTCSSTNVCVPPLTALQFIPVPLCHVTGGTVADNSTQTFSIAGACGIPKSADSADSAVAYLLNVFAEPNTGFESFITLWPTGSPADRPGTSTLNLSGGHAKFNAAIVAAGSDQKISVFASHETDVGLDISGYFVKKGSSGSAFYTLPPCQVANTQNAPGLLGGPSLSAGSTRDFPVRSSPCGIPKEATAYSLNFTLFPNAPGILDAWPAGEAKPPLPTHTLFESTSKPVANAAIIRAATNGAISTYFSNVTGNLTADLAIDINGYFAEPPADGLSFYTVTPCRVLDTRTDTKIHRFNGLLKDGVPVASSKCQVNSSAKAYVLNATVVPWQGMPLNGLYLWSMGSVQPRSSTLTAWDGAVTSNMAIVQANQEGMINAFADGETDLILDILGYFAP